MTKPTPHAENDAALAALTTAVHEMLAGLWDCQHGYGHDGGRNLCADVALCMAEGGGFAERLWAVWSADREADPDEDGGR